MHHSELRTYPEARPSYQSAFIQQAVMAPHHHKAYVLSYALIEILLFTAAYRTV